MDIINENGKFIRHTHTAQTPTTSCRPMACLSIICKTKIIIIKDEASAHHVRGATEVND